MNTGIWIDHRAAVLFPLSDTGTRVTRLSAGALPRKHSTGGWRSGGTAVAQCISNEQRTDERRKHQLYAFYLMIINAAKQTERLFIFGSGNARNELVAEIQKMKGNHAEIAAVEACDKMTEPQVIAKTRAFFVR